MFPKRVADSNAYKDQADTKSGQSEPGSSLQQTGGLQAHQRNSESSTTASCALWNCEPSKGMFMRNFPILSKQNSSTGYTLPKDNRFVNLVLIRCV